MAAPVCSPGNNACRAAVAAGHTGDAQTAEIRVKPSGNIAISSDKPGCSSVYTYVDPNSGEVNESVYCNPGTEGRGCTTVIHGNARTLSPTALASFKAAILGKPEPKEDNGPVCP